jgi:arginase family enzyme
MKPVLIGCPFDNGIQMMLRFGRGITGAADGPQAVLDQFQQTFDDTVPATMLPLHPYRLPTEAHNLHDVDFIQRQQALTETAHQKITAHIQQTCEDGFLPVSIGGDHSLTYPLCRGVSLAHPGQKMGLIYVDAHLDMRPLETCRKISGLISSGNSFRRLIEDNVIDGHNMAAIGIHRSGSDIFQQMAGFAETHGVTVIDDEACRQPETVVRQALAAATINAAFAIKRGDRVGSLEVGKQADLVIWDVPRYQFLSYRFGSNLVKMVVKKGQVVYATRWGGTF